MSVTGSEQIFKSGIFLFSEAVGRRKVIPIRLKRIIFDIM
jgi:hypothetical protein